MSGQIKIEGLRELSRALEQFKKSTARGVMERALKKAAKPIVDTAKMNAPIDTGELRDSIVVEVARRSAGKSAFADALRSGASRAEAGQAARAANRAAAGQGTSATVRIAAKAPHAVFAEFGTQKKGGTFFLSSAIRGKQVAALSTLKTELGREITKSARRIAARNAKKAGQ